VEEREELKQSNLKDKLAELSGEQEQLLTEIKALEKHNKDLKRKRASLQKRVRTKLTHRQIKLFATYALTKFKNELDIDICICCGGPADISFDAGIMGQFGMCREAFDTILKIDEACK
jgi:hypothetical protein